MIHGRVRNPVTRVHVGRDPLPVSDTRLRGVAADGALFEFAVLGGNHNEYCSVWHMCYFCSRPHILNVHLMRITSHCYDH